MTAGVVRLRGAAALLLVLVLHVTLLSRFHVADVRPDVLLLAAIAGGLVAGPERGAVFGFCAGLLADLFLEAPFGLSALCYCLIGFAVGSLQTGILRSAWWIPVVTALGASATGVVVYALLGATVGQTQMVSPRLAVIAGLVGVMNGLLAPAAVRLVGWAFGAAGTA